MFLSLVGFLACIEIAHTEYGHHYEYRQCYEYSSYWLVYLIKYLIFNK